MVNREIVSYLSGKSDREVLNREFESDLIDKSDTELVNREIVSDIIDKSDREVLNREIVSDISDKSDRELVNRELVSYLSVRNRKLQIHVYKITSQFANAAFESHLHDKINNEFHKKMNNFKKYACIIYRNSYNINCC